MWQQGGWRKVPCVQPREAAAGRDQTRCQTPDPAADSDTLTRPGLAPSDSRADGPAGLPAGFPVQHSRAHSRGDGSRERESDSRGRESSRGGGGAEPEGGARQACRNRLLPSSKDRRGGYPEAMTRPKAWPACKRGPSADKALLKAPPPPVPGSLAALSAQLMSAVSGKFLPSYLKYQSK